MTQHGLYELLKTLGLPLAYNAFSNEQEPPFLIYLFSHSHNFLADSKVYMKQDAYQVELYTDKKQPELERRIEDVFDSNEIVYDKTETFIESEKLYEVLYEIDLIGG